MKWLKAITVVLLLGFIILVGVIASRRYTRAEIASAYRLPLRDSPYPALSVPATEDHQGIHSVVGEITGSSSREGGNVNTAEVLMLDDDDVRRAVLPNLRMSSFSLTVQPRGNENSRVRLEFCGATQETGIVDSSSVYGLNQEYVQLVYAEAKRGNTNCQVLLRVTNLTPQLQFKGFEGRSAEIMLKYFTEIDHFYGGKLRGGKWEASRRSGCGDQECYRLIYKPDSDDTTSWFIWEANLSTGDIMPLSDYAKTIENEVRRKGEL
jgi:cbb3-type cytochrome oxidase subunit 3